MPTLSSTADAWIGRTTVTTTADALLRLSTTLTTTADAYLSKPLWTTADAFITDERGSFRGTGTTAQRDALELVQPGDTYLVTDS